MKKVYGSAGCALSSKLKTALAQRLAALAGTGSATTPGGVPIHSIHSVIDAIHTAAPNAHIYIADYPAFVNDQQTIRQGRHFLQLR